MNGVNICRHRSLPEFSSVTIYAETVSAKMKTAMVKIMKILKKTLIPTLAIISLAIFYHLAGCENNKSEAKDSSVKLEAPKYDAETIEKESKHLRFKGVPIDGRLADYTRKMEAIGFTCKSVGNGHSELVGNFAGFDNCIIKVSTQSNTDIVSHIAVQFGTYEFWPDIESNYSQLKSMLTEKYGNPSFCKESFDAPYKLDNLSKMLKIQNHEFDWQTVYSADKGNIKLTIEPTNDFCGSVVLYYYDEINTEIIRSHAMEDL